MTEPFAKEDVRMVDGDFFIRGRAVDDALAEANKRAEDVEERAGVAETDRDVGFEQFRRVKGERDVAEKALEQQTRALEEIKHEYTKYTMAGRIARAALEDSSTEECPKCGGTNLILSQDLEQRTRALEAMVSWVKDEYRKDEAMWDKPAMRVWLLVEDKLGAALEDSATEEEK